MALRSGFSGPKDLSLGAQAENCAGAPDRLAIDDLGACGCKQRWLVEAASEQLPPQVVPMSLSVVTILVSAHREFLVSANRQKSGNRMGADKPSPTRNKHLHLSSPL